MMIPADLDEIVRLASASLRPPRLQKGYPETHDDDALKRPVLNCSDTENNSSIRQRSPSEEAVLSIVRYVFHAKPGL
jgi:hypothetical protein